MQLHGADHRDGNLTIGIFIVRLLNRECYFLLNSVDHVDVIVGLNRLKNLLLPVGELRLIFTLRI